jgi:hypothetical protein
MTVKTDRPVETGGELEAAGVAAVVLAVLNALGVATNAGAGAGASAGLAATDTQNKTDVNVPEVLTGMNAMTQKRALAQESNIDNFSNQIIQNAITQANIVTLNEINNSDLIAKQAIRHTDIAIDREWNLDEQTIAGAALYARLIERLNNPTPPAV